MKVAIIGSGAAAFGVLSSLKNYKGKLDIILFDASKTVIRNEVIKEPIDFYQNKYQSLKRNHSFSFPFPKTYFGEHPNQYVINGKKTFFKSDYFGGLTNFWGGTSLPIPYDDYQKWPFDASEIIPFYHQILQYMSLSGNDDGLSQFFNSALINHAPLKTLVAMDRISLALDGKTMGGIKISAGANRVALSKAPGHSCQSCGECMIGCYRSAFFNAAVVNKQLMQELNVRHITENVSVINMQRKTITVSKNDELESFGSFDKIYICSGCPATTEMLLKSTGVEEVPRMDDNAIFQFGILNHGSATSFNKSTEYFSLANCIAYGQSSEGWNFQIQFYPNFDSLWRMSVPEFIWPFISPAVKATRDRVIFARLYLDSDNSFKYSATLAQGKIAFNPLQTPNTELAKRIIEAIKPLLHNHKFEVLPISPIMTSTSSHIASSFSYGNDFYPVSKYGEVSSGVHLCDSSCFPGGISMSPTFTIMANAARTTHASLEL